MPTYTTHDWIEIDNLPNGGVTGSGLSLMYGGSGLPGAAGHHLGVEDSVSITSPDVNFNVGDTVTIGGTAYTASTVARLNSNVTYGPGSTATNINMLIVQLTPASGPVQTFLIPPDPYGNMPNIETIEVTSTNYAPASIDVNWLSTNNTINVVCFAKGTRIDTKYGKTAVEALKPGDMVRTLDNGFQPIRWVSATRHHWPRAPNKQKPILIKKNMLGAGLPHRDLIVSPQHRMLMPSKQVKSGALGPAKAMTGLSGIRQMNGCRNIAYFHIMFDRHEIILAEGTPTESFYPGSWAMQCFTTSQYAEVAKVLASWPHAKTSGEPRRARQFMNARQTKAHLEARKQCWSEEWLAVALGAIQPRHANVYSAGAFHRPEIERDIPGHANALH